ncbi:Collagenase-like protease, PrtC family [Alteromonadaceae bacterium Bs31]|nr:Collagenase-like protease, PrtC family [Alteromonadaceae bacterium Bs31]
MKIALGPILYYWTRQKVFDFYDSFKKSELPIVYMGETVCSKRKELHLHDWLDIAESMAAQGKEVVLSSLALISARSELQSLKKICANNRFLVEANDMAAVQLLTELNLPFICGSGINIYNAHSLALMHKKGMKRWVLPVELGAEALRGILQDAEKMGISDNLETEVFCYGKLPLAHSARCFTSRAKNRPKDKCELACIDYPEGLLLRSQEEQQLFTINGIQTQSAACYNLLSEWRHMAALGVDVMRLSPQAENMRAVVERFHKVINGSNEEILLLDESMLEPSCNGYWFAKPGMMAHEPAC